MVQAPGDAHGCPACPHMTVGPAIVGSPNVNINGLPAVRVMDKGMHAPCCGPAMWTAVAGAPTVFVNGKPAFRMNDAAQSCGGVMKLIEGSPDVIIGDQSSGGGGSGGGAVNARFESRSSQAASGAGASGTTASQGGTAGPGGGPPGTLPPTPPGQTQAKQEEEKAWIEIELVDEDGQPWNGLDYKLELPDFSEIEGQLDGKGRVRRQEIIPGLARLWLPADDAAYDASPGPAEPANDEAKAWLDVQLVDDGGVPLAGQKVKIELPDGTMVEDQLDDAGRLRREDIVAGTAKLHLPELDRAPPAPRRRAGEEEPETKAWLDLQLVDDGGVPLAGQKVKIELPDGTMVEDQLDDEGRLRREDIKAGTAKLHLVEEDAPPVDAAAPAAGAAEPEAKAWLEVALVDDFGEPLAGQKVMIELPDGTMVEDALDAGGRLRREDIVAGAAKLHLVEEPPADVVAAAVAAAAPPAPEEKGVLDVTFTDDDGVPLAGLAVKVELPDGTVLDEKTDENGRLRRDDVAAGDAKLHLPEDD